MDKHPKENTALQMQVGKPCYHLSAQYCWAGVRWAGVRSAERVARGMERQRQEGNREGRQELLAGRHAFRRDK